MQTETMKKYNKDAVCPKCRHDKVNSIYREKCENCHYMWREKPLNKSECINDNIRPVSQDETCTG